MGAMLIINTPVFLKFMFLLIPITPASNRKDVLSKLREKIKNNKSSKDLAQSNNFYLEKARIDEKCETGNLESLKEKNQTNSFHKSYVNFCKKRKSDNTQEKLNSSKKEKIKKTYTSKFKGNEEASSCSKTSNQKKNNTKKNKCETKATYTGHFQTKNDLNRSILVDCTKNYQKDLIVFEKKFVKYLTKCNKKENSVYFQNISSYLKDYMMNSHDFNKNRSIQNSGVSNSDIQISNNVNLKLTYSGKIIHDLFLCENKIFSEQNKYINISIIKIDEYVLNTKDNKNKTSRNQLQDKLAENIIFVSFEELFDVLIIEKDCLTYFFQPYYSLIKLISEYNDNITKYVKTLGFERIISYTICLNHVLLSLKKKVNENIQIFEQPLDSILIDQDVREKLKVIHYIFFHLVLEIVLLRKEESFNIYLNNLKRYLEKENLCVSKSNIDDIIEKFYQITNNLNLNFNDNELNIRSYSEIKEYIVLKDSIDLRFNEMFNLTIPSEHDIIYIQDLINLALENFHINIRSQHKDFIYNLSNIYFDFLEFNFQEINLFICLSLSDDFIAMSKIYTKKNIEIFFSNSINTNENNVHYLYKSFENIFYIFDKLYEDFSIESSEICYWSNILHKANKIITNVSANKLIEKGDYYNFNEIFKSIKMIQKKIFPFSKVIIIYENFD